jgi:hypothetical protein
MGAGALLGGAVFGFANLAGVPLSSIDSTGKTNVNAAVVLGAAFGATVAATILLVRAAHRGGRP